MSPADTPAGQPPAARQVPCPACRQPSPYSPANPWRPFCSARCREHDLGAWASGDYRMPSPPPDHAEDGPPAAAGD